MSFLSLQEFTMKMYIYERNACVMIFSGGFAPMHAKRYINKKNICSSLVPNLSDLLATPHISPWF